jgi:cobalamin biosynthesis protein CobD/CbiB
MMENRWRSAVWQKMEFVAGILQVCFVLVALWGVLVFVSNYLWMNCFLNWILDGFLA